MKQLIFLIFCLSAYTGKAQWSVNYSDANKDFNAIQFINNQDGFALGSRLDTNTAFLLKTNNGGLTWQETLLPLSFASRMYFFNNLYGYVIKSGSPIKLISTNDGGLTWTSNTLDSCYAVTGMAFINSSTGYYLNNEGRLRGINNNGSSYTYLTDTLSDSGLVLFPDPSTGYTAQGDFMLKTTTAGNSWFYLPTNLSHQLMSNAVAFVNQNVGYVSTQKNTGPNIYKTSNGAQSWQQVGSYNAAVIAANSNYCMAVNNDSIRVIFTDNAAATWSVDPLPTQFNGAVDGAITSNGNAYLVKDGNIFKRTPFVNTIGLREYGLKNNSFKLYPNPVSDKLTIESDTDSLFEIYNSIGELVLTTGSGLVTISDLPKGLYLVKSIRPEGNITSHIIKE